MHELINIIDQWRKNDLHLSQGKFAMRMGMSETQYSQIKRGTSNAGVVMLDRWAAVAREEKAPHILQAIGATVLGLRLEQITVTLD